jgi:hypothetical protein
MTASLSDLIGLYSILISEGFHDGIFDRLADCDCDCAILWTEDGI